MTATNICYNFVGFRCNLPLTSMLHHSVCNHLYGEVHFVVHRGYQAVPFSNKCVGIRGGSGLADSVGVTLYGSTEEYGII